MDVNFPYFPSHTSVNKRRMSSQHEIKLQMQNEKEGRKNSLLLTTEPKDLAKLFNHSSYQLTAEQDICFPSYSRSSEEQQQHQQDKRRKSQASLLHVSESSTTPSTPRTLSALKSSYESINLEALSLFQDIKQSPIPTHQYRRFRASEDDELKIEPAENKLLSLYGDNKPAHLDTLQQENFNLQDKNRFMYYHPEIGCIQGKTLTEMNLPPNITNLQSLLVKENYWIDITSPTDEEMKAISKLFHIHPLTTEDIISHEIREKCDVFRHYMFVCYRAFLHDHHHLLKPVTFYNIVTKSYILTIHFGHVPHVEYVQQRVRQLQDYIEVVPDWINYAVMDEITDSFAPMIQQIESEVDVIDDLVLLYKTDQSDMVLRIGTCRKRVIQMVRLLSTKVEVVRGLIKRIVEDRSYETSDEEGGKIYPDVGLYLGDVQDHILTMLQNLNHYETVLSRSESNYLARISIELTQTSNSTNHVIGRLTIFATVLLPMNLVTGLWGMNVKVPGKDYDNLMYFFWIVISLIAFAILSLTFAKKVKLI